MITTFGEIMLRISPKHKSERILNTTDYTIDAGGSESNVAIALANLGEKTSFITYLPKNSLGEKIKKYLNQEAIETKYIKESNDRIGIYWTENGTGPRNSFVIYDRQNSAFSHSSYEDYPWQDIYRSTDWFHFSGITPALNYNLAEMIQKIVTKITCPYSVDLNFRNNLWNWVDKNPDKIRSIMTKICSKAKLITGNETDFQNIFGITSSKKNKLDINLEIAEKSFKIFPNLTYLAISNRLSFSANRNDWNGYLFVKCEKIEHYVGRVYKLDNIQDRVGTGDSFTAGIIYGLLHQHELTWQQIIDFSVTLGALNHTTMGDSSSFSKEEVFNVMDNYGSGRIIR